MPSLLVATTQPPAKLNLFLEVIAKRGDGFHEIETVMVPIDLCDELRIWRTDASGVEMDVQWLPSRTIMAQRLGVTADPDRASQLLDIPIDDRNLVHRALTEFTNHFQVRGGFGCELRKRIPAGAGMGGASSDAASALLCAAKLCEVPKSTKELREIASRLGSDVPFFLGDDGDSIQAMRATGRGEILEKIEVSTDLNFVVTYPNVGLSTPKVYSQCTIADQPKSSDTITAGLNHGDIKTIQQGIFNRLEEPAKKIVPRIQEILESLWRSGFGACQLTGSGSACFGIADSYADSVTGVQSVQATLQPSGTLVSTARLVSVPAPVMITSEGVSCIGG